MVVHSVSHLGYVAVTGLENWMSVVPAACTTPVTAYGQMTVADLEA